MERMKNGRARLGEPGQRFKTGGCSYSMLTSPSLPRLDEPHWHSQPSVQLAQHSFSHAQSGQPSQQSPLLLQVAFLLLQQPALAAGVEFDDDQPTVPAASAASNTKPIENLAIMESLTPVK
jgi:hypothetical protein